MSALAVYSVAVLVGSPVVLAAGWLFGRFMERRGGFDG
jgi:hypothetical protein